MMIKCKECEKMILYIPEPLPFLTGHYERKKASTELVYLKCEDGHENAYLVEVEE